jgi:outer membrane biogenesis lipoprotein LolB
VDPAYVMTQLGQTDPAFTLRVYGHAMRRDESARERLKALLGGSIPVQKALVPFLQGPRTASNEVPRRRKKRPSPDTSSDGRGGFRTCDLSRVKRALSH